MSLHMFGWKPARLTLTRVQPNVLLAQSRRLLEQEVARVVYNSTTRLRTLGVDYQAPLTPSNEVVTSCGGTVAELRRLHEHTSDLGCVEFDVLEVRVGTLEEDSTLDTHGNDERIRLVVALEGDNDMPTHCAPT